MKPLIKSAALIILVRDQQDSNQFKTLMLRRKSNMSFGSLYVPPGGICDDQDRVAAKSQDFYEYGRITALRETLEETGLLIFPSSKQGLVLQNYAHQKEEFVISEIGKIWEGETNHLSAIFRVSTPQFPKLKRYDCIFYAVILNQSVSWINLRQRSNIFLKPEYLRLNQSECDLALLQTPSKFLQLRKNSENKVNFAPPQIILLHCLSKLSKNAPISRNWRPQPIMFQIQLGNKTNYYYIMGDKNYNIQKLLNEEPESSSKKDLKEHASNFVIQASGSRRLVISGVFSSSYEENSILSLLKSPEAKL